ncbi:Yae1_N domain-containing protein [Rhodotorula toruloides]|nr:Yae1_N domain-containing protein [Rhodotorula toruloides]
MDQQLSFDPLLDLEQQFYQRGFDAGLPHGELHGLFEGRELGREKAWELCEEVGYYEGMAKLWKGILAVQGKDSGRASQSLDQILSLVSQFPTTNDSSSLSSPSNADIDIPALLSSLRSKYRTACASLGVRPRLVAAESGGTSTGGVEQAGEAEVNLKKVGLSL